MQLFSRTFNLQDRDVLLLVNRIQASNGIFGRVALENAGDFRRAFNHVPVRNKRAFFVDDITAAVTAALLLVNVNPDD